MTAPDPGRFEKLGVFYLGRVRDVEQGRTTDELVLYDSKDLTTHAVCVGMTGSGKTGLCVDLIEEAAIDGIPSIVIDPKGDLGNLLLTFPDLKPADFRPWIDEAEAARDGLSPDAKAEATASAWSKGLAAWGQDGDRIRRLRAAADFVVWTPGSSSGLPISVLRSFGPPPPALMADADAVRERIAGTVSGLLALAGIEADPLRSREHVLVSTILDGAWREGRSLDLGALIREIQEPPFQRVGVVDVEGFFPAKDRFALAMALNTLVASPAFASWMEGEPLEASRLLHAPDGRPRVSILSIAHLSDAERMFFVTLVLQEVIGWMRQQSGTGSLRAILFMDEVFGFLPPIANPPSKTPMLTLLKQARAYGLGVVLATQNPVDLDYKALSNSGTWFLGRLQTERDKLRVLDGLEGASASAGKEFDRGRMEAVLSGLSKRMFLLVSAHEDEPVVFESRWAMSYLRGPLTRPQIQTLMSGRRAASMPAPAAPATSASPPPAVHAAARPLMPPGVSEAFLACRPGAASGAVTYRPGMLGRARLHHVSAKDGVDAWREVTLLAPLPERGDETSWAEAATLDAPVLANAPEAGAAFEDLTATLTAKSVASWTKALQQHLFASAPLTVLRCDALDATSAAGESEAAFRGRLAHEARERRDLVVAQLRQKHAPKVQRLQERMRKAEQRVEVQRDQASHQRTSAMLSVGGAVLGALFGRKSGLASRAATAARGFGRASQEGRDVDRAEADVEATRAEIAALEEQLAAEVHELEASMDVTTLVLEPLAIPPRKSDIACSASLAWAPWVVGADGLPRQGW